MKDDRLAQVRRVYEFHVKNEGTSAPLCRLDRALPRTGFIAPESVPVYVVLRGFGYVSLVDCHLSPFGLATCCCILLLLICLSFDVQLSSLKSPDYAQRFMSMIEMYSPHVHIRAYYHQRTYKE